MTLRKAFALAVGITLAGSGAAFAGSAALSDSEMDRVSAQGIQTIVNESNFPVADQNNNLDSVQLNDFAQESSNVEGLINSAVSAVNASANLLYSGPATSSGIEQENDNTAKNHVNDSFAFNNDAYAQNLNKQTQDVNNSFLVTIEDQENNNNSVQMNDNAQQNSEGVSVQNSAFSANNFGLNIYSSDSGNIAGGDITQTNTQRAYNMNNTADAEDGAAYAQNYEEGVVTQRIENSFLDTTIEYQDNNNNSVQVNDDAQQNALVDSLVNTAKSATNTGANLATVGNVTGTDIYQTNTAVAENHVNDAFSVDGDAYAENQNKQTQHVHNGEFPVTAQLTTVIEDQENNNNSVQLNDNAQENVSAVLLENSASSAVNAGLNVLDVGDITNSDDTIYQKNVQTAENFNNYADGGEDATASNKETAASPGQLIINEDVAVILDQNNNNNSVQLNDNAQQYVTVDKLINSANSAVNVGQNLINWDWTVGDVTNSIIHQENTQTAKNHYNDAFASDEIATAENAYKQTQWIANNADTVLIGTQDNNMNSVQLNDNAQRYASAVVLINSAASAVNAGLNVVNAGTLSQTCVKQFNTNTAVNYSNFADGGTFAYAVNRN